LAFDESTFGDELKYDTNSHGTFPHLYGSFKPSDVLWEKKIDLVDGVHKVDL
jgi:uncharacterized protein (DUF952 family)